MGTETVDFVTFFVTAISLLGIKRPLVGTETFSAFFFNAPNTFIRN